VAKREKKEIMNPILKNLENDPDGMSTYEYIVNNVDTVADDMPGLIEILKKVDHTGQFLSSTARFLNAVDKESFSPWISPLIEAAIVKDRERRLRRYGAPIIRRVQPNLSLKTTISVGYTRGYILIRQARRCDITSDAVIAGNHATL